MEISKVNKIAGMLKDKKMTLSLAESCTGGLISNKITNIPGSSAFFKGSVVAYSNEIKEQTLGVSGKTLEKYGAVSRQVAKGMADGVRKKMASDISAAVTGIAGPGGGSAGKPVGLAYIAVSTSGRTVSRELRLKGTRNTLKKGFTEEVLNLLRKEI